MSNRTMGEFGHWNLISIFTLFKLNKKRSIYLKYGLEKKSIDEREESSEKCRLENQIYKDFFFFLTDTTINTNIQKQKDEELVEVYTD